MNLNDWIRANKHQDRKGYTTLPHILCTDGTRLGVQIGKAKCAIFDSTRGIYTHVEVDIFEGQAPKHWQQWRTTAAGVTYDWVPTVELEKLIDSAGGLLAKPVGHISPVIDYLS